MQGSIKAVFAKFCETVLAREMKDSPLVIGDTELAARPAAVADQQPQSARLRTDRAAIPGRPEPRLHFYIHLQIHHRRPPQAHVPVAQKMSRLDF